MNNYEKLLKIYENSIEKNHKKNNGIFYTDLALAETMLEELNIPKDSIILDPCCGCGVFLYAADKQGFPNLYGVDQDQEAIEFCQNHIEQGIFVASDSIGIDTLELLNKIDLKTKPDVVIGNPPYVPLKGNKIKEDSFHGNNLFVKSLLKAFEIVKEGGIISYILPKNVLHVKKYSPLRKILLKEKTIISIVDIGKYFKNVGGEQIILTVKNNKLNKENFIKIKRLFNDCFDNKFSVSQSFYKDEIILFKSKKDVEIYEEINNNCFKKINFHICRGNSHSDQAILGKDIRKFGYNNKKNPENNNKIFIQNIYSSTAGIIAAVGVNKEAKDTVTILSNDQDDERIIRYVLGVLHSRLCNLFLCKYCFNSSTVTIHIDASYLTKFPIIYPNKIKDFNTVVEIVRKLEDKQYRSTEWFYYLERLNQIVYKIYGIIQEKSDYIDEEIKKIQSKKWTYYF